MFDSINKKTIIIAGSSIVGLILVILLGSWLLTIFRTKYFTYEEVESKIEEAAKEYYTKNPTLLPVNEGEYSLLFSTLVEGEYIKPLNELLKDGDKCSAEIMVSLYAETYTYISYLKCPGSYETKELYKTILDSNELVESGTGLYQASDDSYYFRGEVKNNYIEFGDSESSNLWRIISIDNENSVKIMAYNRTKTVTSWDNRFNVDKKSSTGYNEFEKSRIKEKLLDGKIFDDIISENIKKKIVAKNWCIGLRSQTETDMSGEIECSTISEDKLSVGLLATYEYLRASIDENCINTTSTSCINYNFFADFKFTTLTLTGVEEDNYHIYTFDSAHAYVSKASGTKKIAPVVYLNKRVFYKSGTGTLEDPYVVR